MKRIFIFNWEIKTSWCFAGNTTIITHSGIQYTFPDKGSQLYNSGYYTTFLVQPENTINL